LPYLEGRRVLIVPQLIVDLKPGVSDARLAAAGLDLDDQQREAARHAVNAPLGWTEGLHPDAFKQAKGY
jgi:hypothetical protein